MILQCALIAEYQIYMTSTVDSTMPSNDTLGERRQGKSGPHAESVYGLQIRIRIRTSDPDDFQT